MPAQVGRASISVGSHRLLWIHCVVEYAIMDRFAQRCIAQATHPRHEGIGLSTPPHPPPPPEYTSTPKHQAPTSGWSVGDGRPSLRRVLRAQQRMCTHAVTPYFNGSRGQSGRCNPCKFVRGCRGCGEVRGGLAWHAQ